MSHPASGPAGERPDTEPGSLPSPASESASSFEVSPGTGETGWSIHSCPGARPGAEPVEGGVRFGVYSAHARRIHVALFPPGAEPGSDPVAVLALPDCRGHLFAGFVPGIGPGWQYGFHAEGPFDPRHGHRFNPRKFLLDPYAKAIAGTFRNADGVLCGHVPGAGHDADLLRDHRPSLPFMPRALVMDDAFDWQGVEPPRIAREDLVLYEMHVRGFTRDASSDARNPGTYLGVIDRIPHLKALGVNAVELLPVHAKYDEDLLRERGLSNYWGYNTAGFFALEPSYGTGVAPGCERDEFRTMVRELHRAGILVILDVVYNHTAEGSERGPTLSLRGLDNRSYYALTGPEDAPARFYHNRTGCGNTLDFGSPAVVRLVNDSLRHFATVLGVDGFRFDLATVHGRSGSGGFDPATSPFFAAIAQDPVLSERVLIAEPWDVEAHGTGRFPPGWMEWNDDFRDTVRRFVRGDGGLLGALREKLEGSPDQYAGARREPWTSVNFVTAHDGFTLNDLVTYGHKHNLANGEGNRDGSHENHNWNCGHEGPGGGAKVEALRARQVRNLWLLTVLARGTPMLLGGDEFLRTQGGNNNAYCQDGPVSWFDWTLAERNAGFLRFAREALAWRNELVPAARWAAPETRAWGRCWQGFTAAGKPWPHDHPPDARHAAFVLHRKPATGPWPETPDPAEGGLACLLLNTEDETVLFHLPPLVPGWEWSCIADTSVKSPGDIAAAANGAGNARSERCEAEPRSIVLFHAVRAAESTEAA